MLRYITKNAYVQPSCVKAGAPLDGLAETRPLPFSVSMQDTSFLRPDPSPASPTRLRLAPLQHSPSQSAARVHVPSQSEVDARLGGSFSVFNQYATKNLSGMMRQMMERAVTEQPVDMNQFMIDFLLEHGGGGHAADVSSSSTADVQRLEAENESMLGEYAELAAELAQMKAQLPSASQLGTTLAIIKPDAMQRACDRSQQFIVERLCWWQVSLPRVVILCA